MNKQSKILWGEGLFLRPQHFQQQDAYHEQRLMHMHSAGNPCSWGIQRVNVDSAGLTNGVVRLTEIEAIFSDGEVISAPGKDELPLPLNLKGQTEAKSVTILLSIPLLKETGKNYRKTAYQEHDGEARYVSESQNTVDLFTDSVSSEIAFLKKNIQLAFDHAPKQHLNTIPLLSLRRASSGGYEIDPDFIPPSVSIAASSRLQRMLSQLLDMLEAKNEALYRYHRQPTENVVHFRAGDNASFWFLQTTCSATSVLRHLQDHPELPTENLYRELLRIAGALMAFSRKKRLSDLPRYQHESPTKCFTTLEAIIHDLLDTVFATKTFAIALQEYNPSLFKGNLNLSEISDNTMFYLAVQANVDNAKLSHEVPILAKMGSPEDVAKLIASSMPGLSLTYTPKPPEAIPVRPNQTFFIVDRNGDFFNPMLKSQQVAVFLPKKQFPELKLEFIGVNG